MKYCLGILVLLVAGIVPRVALAESAKSDGGSSRTVACGLRVSIDEVPSYRHTKCLMGVALGIFKHSMRVRPPKGRPRSVGFNDETLFETDSGEGALTGLVASDRVCVAFTPTSHAAVARVVAFDPSSLPCRHGKRRKPVGDNQQSQN